MALPQELEAHDKPIAHAYFLGFRMASVDKVGLVGRDRMTGLSLVSRTDSA